MKALYHLQVKVAFDLVLHFSLDVPLRHPFLPVTPQGFSPAFPYGYAEGTVDPFSMGLVAARGSLNPGATTEFLPLTIRAMKFSFKALTRDLGNNDFLMLRTNHEITVIRFDLWVHQSPAPLPSRPTKIV